MHLIVLMFLAQQPAPAAAGFPGQWAPPATTKYAVWPKFCARFTGDERAACLDYVAQDWPRLSRYADANRALAPAKKGERRVVFMGDSITDNWSKPGYGGFFPGKSYVNRGIGGQTTQQMLVRFRPDVIALQPRAVVILAGTNDISGNAGPVSLEAIEDNLASMADLAHAHGIKVILASLLPVTDAKVDKQGKPIPRTGDRPPEKLKALNAWIADFARKNKHVFLDYASALSDASGALKADLTDDGLHPTAAGYAVMAPLAEQSITKAIGK